jgi:hypothetical protein
MPAQEVVELCSQLLATYVIEGVVPLARAGEVAELAQDAGGEETFAQLIRRLKTTKRDPVLERFFVDGENISVRIDGQGVLPVTPYRRPVGPPAAQGSQPGEQQQPRREGAPGASTNIYNRSLYESPQAPQGASPPAPPPGPAARGAPPKPAPAAGAQPTSPAPGASPGQPARKDEPKNDRFTLIELE